MYDYLFHTIFILAILVYVFILALFWFYFERRIRVKKYSTTKIGVIDIIFTLLLIILIIPCFGLLCLPFSKLLKNVNYGYLNFFIIFDLMMVFEYIVSCLEAFSDSYEKVRISVGMKFRQGKRRQLRKYVDNPYCASSYGISFFISVIFIYLINFNTHNIQSNSSFFIISNFVTICLCAIFIFFIEFMMIKDSYVLSDKKKILFTILNILFTFIAFKNFFDFSYLIYQNNLNTITFIVYLLVPFLLLLPISILNKKKIFSLRRPLRYIQKENRNITLFINFNNASLVYSLYMLIISLILLMINI